jgi:aspartate/methionine/tyrosine aminotransferase
MKFLDNNWGWDVHKTPPFLAFRALRRRAATKHGEVNVLDISQGEPGYGFAPSTRSRRFYSFLLMVDTVLNNNQTDEHFGNATTESHPDIVSDLEKIARETYAPAIAKELIADLAYFLAECERICKNQGFPKSKFEILYDLFKFSIPSGGRYPNSWGEMLVRMAVAEECADDFQFPVSFEDIVILNGASQGVAMFFKGLGHEGIGYLKSGDTVLMISPVYAPYTQFIEDRELNLISISIDAETGKVDTKSVQEAMHSEKRIKAIIMIDPNNPTGFPLEDAVLEQIADIAEHHNSIILTDEVYAPFFPGKKSIVQVRRARKRTLRVNSLSKIERATGVRFGELYLAPESRDYIAQEIIEKECPGFTEKYRDMRWFMFLAKSFGGSTIGVFQHISGAAGPTQILGLCHIILGKKERAEYVAKLRKKVDTFYEALGLKKPKNTYYGVIDLRKLEGPETAKKPIEQVLTEFAEEGAVVVMPAFKFFSETDRKKSDHTRFIRVSLPNLSVEKTARAGKLIKDIVSK